MKKAGNNFRAGAQVVAILAAGALASWAPGHAQAAEPPAAAAPARAPRPPPPPPVADLSGAWILSTNVGKDSVSTIVLKQDAQGILTGELKLPTPMPGLPPINFYGQIEGAQVDVMAWFPYQGGELIQLRGEYKNDQLVVKKAVIHSAPRKWRIDSANVDEVYVRVR